MTIPMEGKQSRNKSQVATIHCSVGSSLLLVCEIMEATIDRMQLPSVRDNYHDDGHSKLEVWLMRGSPTYPRSPPPLLPSLISE